ncbi:MAG TPA: hypothetical protein VKD08_13945 [Ignavibacteriaceae bacterium]|nr:hypothetical protein [Ignavibacteriaceae bacterium]
MKIIFTKSTVIQVLLIAVILLLTLNIVLEKYYHPKPPDRIELSADVINKKFLASLNNYNIDSSWITLSKVSGRKDDSLKFNYNVAVPADLPVSLLLREVQDHFDTNDVHILSSEFKSDNSTELKILSGDNLKLRAVMRYNNTINRRTDTIGFVLTGVEELNNEKLQNLLLIPEHFTGLLTPSKHSQQFLKTLKDNQKEAAVLLNDDIPELEFKLKTGYSSRRIKNSILSILGKFQSAAFFVIDQNSDIYNSMHYAMIRQEFSKRNITLIRMDRFTEPANSSPDGILTAIRADLNKNRLFLISAEDFLDMPPFLASLRKTGYKFINPSVMINH